MTAPVLYETHSHTPLCKHATGEPEDYAAVAFHRNLAGLTVTCHNPMPDGFSADVRMAPEQLPEYIDLVARARDTWAGKLDVRLGLECDYFPGYEGWVEQQLKLAEFQYVIGSVHPQTAEYREKYRCDAPLEYQQTYFRLLADAAETGLFDTISHPDLIKNETAADWLPSRLMPDICRTLDRIAATGVAMELNTSGINKRVPEMNPFPEMLAEMCSRDIPVVIGADAHEPDRVGDGFIEALLLLEQAGYRSVRYYIDRQPHSVAIDEARASLL